MRTSFTVLTVGAIGIAVALGQLNGWSGPPELGRRPGRAISLGVMAPLHGDLENYGRAIQRGVDLAIASLSSDSPAISVSYEDACLPMEALSASRKLLHSTQIDALVGNYCVIALPAVANLYARAKVPLLHTSVVPEEFVGGKSFVFTTNGSVRSQATALAHYSRAKLQSKKAAVVYLQTPWGESFQSEYAAAFRELGGETAIIEPTEIGQSDFRSVLVRIKSNKPEVVFLALLGPSLGNALKQMSELGMKLPVLATDDAEDESVRVVAGSSADGLRFFSPETLEVSEAAKEFRVRYQQRFGHLPSLLAANAYDATVLTVQAVERCAGDRDCLKSSLLNLPKVSGASGEFSIDSGRTERSLTFKEIVDGEIRVVR